MTVALLAIALACVALPLATYTTTLAVLGLPHVLVELRYIQCRFGARVARSTAAAMGVLLLAVVGLRVARNLGAWTGDGRWELGLIGLLVLAVLPALGWRWRGAGLVLAGTAGVFALFSPSHALLFLAVTHNLTPLGFLAEVLSGARRRRALLIGVTLFIGVPLLIATGAPFRLLALWGWTAPDLSLLPTGPLASHFAAYLPSTWRGEPWAGHAFTGVVFAQCMHYAAVLHVLPRLQRGVRSMPMGAFVALATCGLLLLFVGDFSEGRRWYGVAAAVHAWVELPILLLAFGQAKTPS